MSLIAFNFFRINDYITGEESEDSKSLDLVFAICNKTRENNADEINIRSKNEKRNVMAFIT